jgi:phage terminase Nu1 subunit (DNA packaging protein)
MPSTGKVGNVGMGRRRPRPGQRIEGQVIRWSFETAAREFNTTRETLLKKLTASGWVKNGHGAETPLLTQHITRALFPDEASQHYEMTKARAEALQMENARSRGELIPITDIKRHDETVFAAIKEEILSFDLSDKEKEILLNRLAGLKKK